MTVRASSALLDVLGTELPIIQAPMAGVQGSALAIAASNARALGSLPCALLGLDTMRDELGALRSHTTRPYNVNFFCHTRPDADAAVERERRWREALAPYYAALGSTRRASSRDPSGLRSCPTR